jgi:hypothetical protein
MAQGWKSVERVAGFVWLVTWGGIGCGCMLFIALLIMVMLASAVGLDQINTPAP